ncbi:MAG: hypothetical protein AAGJ85_05600, partial [Pseudomonadota bacterium]
MTEGGKTKGWFMVGMGLILLGGGIYALFMLLGISMTIGAATAEVGAPIWAILAIPGLVALGFLVLIRSIITFAISTKKPSA